MPSLPHVPAVCGTTCLPGGQCCLKVNADMRPSKRLVRLLGNCPHLPKGARMPPLSLLSSTVLMNSERVRVRLCSTFHTLSGSHSAALLLATYKVHFSLAPQKHFQPRIIPSPSSGRHAAHTQTCVTCPTILRPQP